MKDPRLRLLIAGAVLVVAGLTTGWFLLRDLPATCRAPDVSVKVAAAPDIAPALRQVAAGFDVASHGVNGRCVRIAIEAADPAVVARSRTPAADAWIPDSSMWITIARRHAASLPALGTSIAMSPVVIAVPRPVAADLPTPVSWRLLGSAVGSAVKVLDPARSAPGIAAVLATKDTSLVRRDSVPDTGTLFRAFGGLADMRTPVVVTTEQAVHAYNAAHAPNPAAAIVPDEGTILMDYPLVTVTQDLVRAQAVDAFRYAVRASASVQVLQHYGFRPPGGPGTNLPKLLPLPSSAAVVAAARI